MLEDEGWSLTADFGPPTLTLPKLTYQFSVEFPKHERIHKVWGFLALFLIFFCLVNLGGGGQGSEFAGERFFSPIL